MKATLRSPKSGSRGRDDSRDEGTRSRSLAIKLGTKKERARTAAPTPNANSTLPLNLGAPGQIVDVPGHRKGYDIRDGWQAPTRKECTLGKREESFVVVGSFPKILLSPTCTVSTGRLE